MNELLPLHTLKRLIFSIFAIQSFSNMVLTQVLSLQKVSGFNICTQIYNSQAVSRFMIISLAIFNCYMQVSTSCELYNILTNLENAASHCSSFYKSLGNSYKYFNEKTLSFNEDAEETYIEFPEPSYSLVHSKAYYGNPCKE